MDADTTDLDADEQTSPSTRRAFLTAAAVGGTAIGLGTVPGAGQTEPERIELGGDTPGWVGRAPADIEGETNPTLTLVPGRSYEVVWENVDGQPHNFVVRDGDGEDIVRSEIISEEGATQTVEFEATEAMAEYLCEVHPTTMLGDVSVEEQDTPTPTPDADEEEDTETETETEDDDEDDDDAEPAFESDLVEEQVGDVASLTLDLGDRDEMRVSIGSEAVNYLTSFTVVDGSDDGEVTIELNTFVAGSGDDPGVSAADEDDEIRDVERELVGIDPSLSSAPYPVEASADGRVVAESLLVLQPRETEGAGAGVAPRRADTTQSEDFAEAVTERERVAVGDWAVLRVDASGLYATLDEAADLRSDEYGYDLTIEEADVINRSPMGVPLDEIALVTDAENDRFFAAVDSDRFDVDQPYEATFTITDANPYVADGEEESVSASFRTVERTATIDAEEPVSVPTGEVTLSGTTTVAPGTTLTVSATGEGGDEFLKIARPTVEADGAWSASLDFSDVAPGTPVTFEVVGLSDQIEGEVSEE
ncbi:cupredoxin domain-containing protein [Halomicrobium salinisoli]|uniref:cupredoxin domain-containing protein n=1 Tax=Halomicrobium salinisoli TaxID=2878391 RepID=UPI001CF055C6|nr:BGTF surface domain-containing protein [Halomicrobium salinisoli]